MKPPSRWMLLGAVAILFATGCGPSTPRTPLHVAVKDGNYGAVRQHIAAHSDLNAKDKAGWTPLHLAATQGDLPMVQLLADAGAEADRTGPGGRTPLDVAREQGKTSVVQFLAARPKAAPQPAAPEKPGRRLIDGGLGVSEVLDAH